MTDATWCAFVGEVGHRTELNLFGLTWAEARTALTDYAYQCRENSKGGCSVCYKAAGDALVQLGTLPEGEPWEGAIDRDDLILGKETTDRGRLIVADHTRNEIMYMPAVPAQRPGGLAPDPRSRSSRVGERGNDR